jgi:hypothetical protein
MSRAGDPYTDRYAPDGLAPATLEAAERLLAERWDPSGTIARGLARRPTRGDGMAPRSMADAALQCCGILAGGGAPPHVSGFLRIHETAVLGEPADDAEKVERAHRRWHAGTGLWCLVRGVPERPWPGKTRGVAEEDTDD